ncbi:hypothetical protein [Deinococcus multiflagellatus]|uniref:Phage protein n=1 Tax=Deinococcus multiflagellatus TaxID=1656887 RepID=A0ABW1ZFZ8_9DEIO|nr:hypothetical protein [Deinococcus multiflagellatus]MBZ9712162.1 hypothetical protein [Deinococcus multiflagellatus]
MTAPHPLAPEMLDALAELLEASQALHALRGQWEFAKDPAPPEWATTYNREVAARQAALSLDASTIRAASAALRAQAAAEAELREAARVLHGYSRRYCDGRSTYAPAEHNRATHTLLRLGVTLDPDPISKSGPFARDGMYGLEPADLAALAQAQEGQG